MVALMAEVRERHQVVLTELNLGGGNAVPYRSGDPEADLPTLAASNDGALRSACAQYGYPRPQIVIEPGRAIAARAGVTLYRVIAVKRQPDGRSFVAVDGAVTDSRREIHRGTCQPAPDKPHRARHGRGPARRGRR